MIFYSLKKLQILKIVFLHKNSEIEPTLIRIVLGWVNFTKGLICDYTGTHWYKVKDQLNVLSHGPKIVANQSKAIIVFVTLVKTIGPNSILCLLKVVLHSKISCIGYYTNAYRCSYEVKE